LPDHRQGTGENAAALANPEYTRWYRTDQGILAGMLSSMA
jgi:hypothetical protein